MLRKVLGALCLLLPLLNAACGDGGGNPTASAPAGFIGTWKIVEANNNASANVGTIYKFDKDGKFLLGGVTPCTYSYTAPDLATECGKDWKVTWKLQVVDASTIVLEHTDKRVGDVFKLERQ